MGIMALCTSKGSVSVERVNPSSQLMYQGLGQNVCATCAGYDYILPMMGKKGKTVNEIQQDLISLNLSYTVTILKVIKVKQQDKQT